MNETLPRHTIKMSRSNTHLSFTIIPSQFYISFKYTNCTIYNNFHHVKIVLLNCTSIWFCTITACTKLEYSFFRYKIAKKRSYLSTPWSVHVLRAALKDIRYIFTRFCNFYSIIYDFFSCFVCCLLSAGVILGTFIFSNMDVFYVFIFF